ncbi:hypothetical protein L873DRAFT_1842778, partial [Choiromyces venosus 120613-1]
MSLRRHVLLNASIILLCYVTSVHSFNDTACNRTITELGPLDPLRYFDKDPSGNNILDKRDRMLLSDCKKMCGKGYAQYPHQDILGRVALWLVPVFMVVGNFQFPPLGPLNSFCVAIHLFGDPIDLVYSLLVKLEISRKIHAHWVDSPPAMREGEFYESEKQRKRALRDIATVNAVFDEWNYSAVAVYPQMRRLFDRLQGERRTNFIVACSEAAHRLSDSRVDDSLRT